MLLLLASLLPALVRANPVSDAVQEATNTLMELGQDNGLDLK